MSKAPMLVFLAGGWIGYGIGTVTLIWSLWTPGPVVSVLHPAVALNQPMPGQVLIIKWYVQKIKDCGGRSVAWTEDKTGATVQIREAVMKLPSGIYNGRPAQYPIPAWLHPGDYNLYVMLMPDCGGLIRNDPQRLPPVPFVVRSANE